MVEGPTKSGILGIDGNSYRPLLDAVHAMATKYEQKVSTFKGYVDKPGGTAWEGQTAEAGQHNVTDGWKVTARIQDIDTKFQTTAGLAVDHTIVPELRNCQTMIENIEAQRNKGLTLTEDLQVGYNPPPGVSEKQATENAKVAEARGKELKESARKWFEAEQEVKRLAEGAIRDIENEVNGAAGTFDIGKAVKDNAPRTMDPNATTVNYKEIYPKTPAAPTDPATIDPKVAALVPGLDPNATKAAGALPQGSLPELLDAASKAKPPIDPSAGSLTDKLLRIDPTMAARQSHVEKTPGQALDPNSPAGKASINSLRGMYQSQGLPPAQVEAKVQEALKAGGQDQYAVKFADPNAPSATPSEHVSRDFGEQFNKFTNGISDAATRTIDGQIEQGKILTGQAGPGAPGVAEAWKELGINAAHQVHELTTDPLAAPKMGIEQAKDFINSPSEFIGKNIIVGTEALATGGIGGEAALGARGLLGDLTGTEGRALTHGLDDATPSHHTPPPQVEHPTPSGDHPTGHLPPHGEPGSFGYDDDGSRLRYANGRPPYGSTQEVDVWNQSREDQLQRIDNEDINLPRPGEGQQWTLLHPNGPIGEDWTVENGHRLVDWQEGQKRDGLWDMGHDGGLEYRKLRELYLSHEIDFDEYMRQYQNHENYNVQDPYRNRSHIDEHP